MTKSETAAAKKKRSRSPNYPFVDLETAIKRAKAVYDVDHTHAVPAGIAHKRWDYTPFGSAGDQCVAALRAYGLIQIEGVKKARKIVVTSMAERIIGSAPDRGRLIQDAALSPAIHRELWDKFQGQGLPSDDVIRSYLVWEREGGRFNQDVVDGVIERFRSTITFAKLGFGDIIEEEVPDDGAEDDQIMPPGTGQLPRSRTTPDSLGVKLSFPFGDGNFITIVMGKRVSPAQFEKTVKKVYELSVAAFVDNRLSDDVSDETSDNNSKYQS